MTLSLPTADVKSVLNDALAQALSTEQALAAEAQDEIRRLVDDLYPLVTAEVQAMLTAASPQVPQAYLAILQGIVEAGVARLGLKAVAVQRQALAAALQTSVRVLALVLRAAVVV